LIDLVKEGKSFVKQGTQGKSTLCTLYYEYSYINDMDKTRYIASVGNTILM
jgi:hypothetical protein